MPSFRGMIRGNSGLSSSSSASDRRSNNDSLLGDDSEISMQGWMRKQKETLRSWPRRYFALSGQVLTYYDSEDTSRPPRGVLQFSDVSPLTTENNGLLLHLEGGKEVRLIADTHVAYAAWMSTLSAALKKPATSKSRAAKDGWAHCLTDDDVWTRYFIVVQNDSFSCYESEEEDAELALSGLIRAVEEWDGKRYGLKLLLNRGRRIQLCFDSAEEKMTWFLTLEFAVSHGQARMKKEIAAAKSGELSANLTRRKSEAASAVETQATEAEADDGVWI